MFSQPIIERRMIDETNTRLCCPLSFCCSLEHTTVQDCDHPDKLQFIEPIHTYILRNIHYKISDFLQDNHENNNDGILTSWLNEIQQVYFREPMDEEQLHILLYRLKVPTILYWNASYDERTQLVLEEYRKIIHRFMEPVVIEENVFIDRDFPHSSQPNNEEDLLNLDMVYENETTFLIPDDEELNLLNDEPLTNGGTAIRVLYKGDPDEVMKQEECPICYEIGCFIKMIKCSHNFCDCIITYIIKKKGMQEIAGCPCCREKITEMEIYNKRGEWDTTTI